MRTKKKKPLPYRQRVQINAQEILDAANLIVNVFKEHQIKMVVSAAAMSAILKYFRDVKGIEVKNPPQLVFDIIKEENAKPKHN